jgi:hypothetical protein
MFAKQGLTGNGAVSSSERVLGVGEVLELSGQILLGRVQNRELTITRPMRCDSVQAPRIENSVCLSPPGRTRYEGARGRWAVLGAVSSTGRTLDLRWRREEPYLLS